jgi:preprotein translocase subunit SecD
VIDAPKNFPVSFPLFGKQFEFTLCSPVIRIGNFYRELVVKQGLDLLGGTEVTLEADMQSVEQSDRQDALDSAKEIIARRVDLYGVAEPSIKTVVSSDTYRILVALPGVSNPDEALDLIGKTASLDFRELPVTTDSALYSDFIATGLTGKDLKSHRELQPRQ